MPTIQQPQQSADGTNQGPQAEQQQQRTSFRPPWVKEGPDPLPMPTAPWTLTRQPLRRTSNAAENNATPPQMTDNGAPVRKQSKITIIPSRPNENGIATPQEVNSTTSKSPQVNAVQRQESVNQSRPKQEVKKLMLEPGTQYTAAGKEKTVPIKVESISRDKTPNTKPGPPVQKQESISQARPQPEVKKAIFEPGRQYSVPVKEKTVPIKVESVTRDKTANARQEPPTEKEKEIPIKQESVSGKDKIVSEKEKIVPIRQESAAGREKIVPEKEKVIPIRQESVAGKEKIAAEKEKVIPIRQESVSGKEKIVPVKPDTPTNREKTIPLKQDIPSSREKVVPIKQEMKPSKEEVGPLKQERVFNKEKVSPTKEKSAANKEKMVPIKQESQVEKEITPAKNDPVINRPAPRRQNSIKDRPWPPVKHNSVENRENLVPTKQEPPKSIMEVPKEEAPAPKNDKVVPIKQEPSKPAPSPAKQELATPKEKAAVMKQETNSKAKSDIVKQDSPANRAKPEMKKQETVTSREKCEPLKQEPTRGKPEPGKPEVKGKGESTKQDPRIKPESVRRQDSVSQEPKDRPIITVQSKKREPDTAKPQVKSPDRTTDTSRPPPSPPAMETPKAPPLPPPPMPQFDKKPTSKAKLEKIENLRSRPRKRPDWGAMMKEVESGRKLRHVECNDRSSPILPKIKVKDRFMYESEKATVHNQLLKEIQAGVSLKRVQTNDRSRPQLEGLRKFRRQLTIEEQIQKAEVEPVEVLVDELDDIDKVRDDLQSTKQMLALELKNKEAVERENKKLLAKILNLELELEKERNRKDSEIPQAHKTEEQQMIKDLQQELRKSQKATEEIENKFHKMENQLDITKHELEEAQRKNDVLEKKFALYKEAHMERQLAKQPSAKKIASLKDVRKGVPQEAVEDEESEYEEVTESESEEESSEEEGENAEAVKERRTARELKLLATKLKSFKDKEAIAKKERKALREQLKKQQAILKEEKKNYKMLQKEVDKMAKLMKEDEDDELEDEEEEEEETEESETESESEESEDEESDGDLPPDAPPEKKKQNFTERAKRHENIFNALKKGNYLLKANIDRLKDELLKQKEMSLTLQEDLNSVLAELG